MIEVENERTVVEILGIEIGTASGWDDMDTAVFFFYDFEPNRNCSLPAGDINVDLNQGQVEIYQDGEIFGFPFFLLDILNETRRRLLNEE